MRTQSFIVPDRPNANHRPRTMIQLEVTRPQKPTKKGHMRESRSEVNIKGTALIFSDELYKEYLSLVRTCATEAKIVIFERCRIQIELHIPMLGTDFKQKQNAVSERLDRPDLDNLKAIKDGLNGIAFADDKHALWECPYVVFEAPPSDWWVNVIITEAHWTEFISTAAVQWCVDNNYKIPYLEENYGLSEGNQGLFGATDIRA